MHIVIIPIGALFHFMANHIHFRTKPSNFAVRVGSTIWDKGTPYRVKEVVLHPSMNLCLMILDYKMKLSPAVHVAVLPYHEEPFPPVGSSLFYVGCGLITRIKMAPLCLLHAFPVHEVKGLHRNVTMGFSEKSDVSARVSYGDIGAGIFDYNTMVVYALVLHDLTPINVQEDIKHTYVFLGRDIGLSASYL